MAATRRLARGLLSVLQSPCPREKATRVGAALAAWEDSSDERDDGKQVPLLEVPDWPSRPAKPVLLDDQLQISKAAHRVEANLKVVHSLAHIELNAMDMYCDTMLRAYLIEERSTQSRQLPLEFYDTFLRVAADESRSG